MKNNPQAQFAIEAVCKGAQLAQQIQDEIGASSITKSDRSPVTMADFAVQAFIGAQFEKYFPNELLVGEEEISFFEGSHGEIVLKKVVDFVRRYFPKADSEAVRSWVHRGASEPAERFWTLDPIDGTKGYLRGEQYAVALALVEKGEVQIGALGCPHLTPEGRPQKRGSGAVFVAVRGEGAWGTSLQKMKQLHRLSVSDCADPKRACLLRSVEKSHTDVERIDRLLEALGTSVEPIFMDSQAKYAVLAAGGGDFLIRFPSLSRAAGQMQIWDHAAGGLIIEEAGGRITDIDGKPLDFTTGRLLLRNRGILATNRHLHDVLLEAIQKILP
ncbi:MAG: inositol monophosphatase family protein [Deltaproteobacteria bacterium]|nr:inositol monophosphatase family protein [Deltaproteobacteria bacterium]